MQMQTNATGPNIPEMMPMAACKDAARTRYKNARGPSIFMIRIVGMLCRFFGDLFGGPFLPPLSL